MASGLGGLAGRQNKWQQVWEVWLADRINGSRFGRFGWHTELRAAGLGGLADIQNKGQQVWEVWLAYRIKGSRFGRFGWHTE